MVGCQGTLRPEYESAAASQQPGLASLYLLRKRVTQLTSKVWILAHLRRAGVGYRQVREIKGNGEGALLGLLRGLRILTLCVSGEPSVSESS